MSLARLAQRVRLSNPTDAELAVERFLKLRGISYDREVIVQNGDRFLLLDFLLTKWNLVLEIDGGQHRANKIYDAKRSMFLARRGYKVARFWNSEWFNGNGEARLLAMLGLGSDQTP